MKCFRPIYIWADVPDKDGVIEYKQIPVPCGRCEACLKTRADGFIFRLLEEQRVCSSSYFFTLTYDDDNLPIVKVRDPNEKVFINGKFEGYGCDKYVASFNREDIRNFVKRFRKLISPYKVRFFINGEYGPEHLRPHYHGIIFNFPFNKQKLYDYIDSTWQKGFISCDTLNANRIVYIAKYCNSVTDVPAFMPRPFVYSCRRPALGSSYLERSDRVEWHKNTLNTRAPLGRELHSIKEMRLPRYLYNKIFNEDEKFKIRNQYLNDHPEIELMTIPFKYLTTEEREIVRDELDKIDLKRRRFQSQFNRSKKNNKRKDI